MTYSEYTGLHTPEYLLYRKFRLEHYGKVTLAFYDEQRGAIVCENCCLASFQFVAATKDLTAKQVYGEDVPFGYDYDDIVEHAKEPHWVVGGYEGPRCEGKTLREAVTAWQAAMQRWYKRFDVLPVMFSAPLEEIPVPSETLG